MALEHLAYRRPSGHPNRLPNCRDKLFQVDLAFTYRLVERLRVALAGFKRLHRSGDDLRTRVRTYFTASETRSRMGEMVGIATSVTGIECATPLEAEVRELRLIAEHKPRYNKRSRFPEKVHFVKLTREQQLDVIHRTFHGAL